MPSASSLREPSPAQSSSHGPSSSTSDRAWSSNRPSPYASDHSRSVISRRSRAEASEARAGIHGSTKSKSLSGDDKATIAYATDDFLATMCLSHVWERHCESRTSKAREALVTANRKAAGDGRPTIKIDTYSKGKVSAIVLHISPNIC